MKALVWSWLVVGVSLCTAVSTGAQIPVGALAIDERRGEQYGWAVDYETEAAAWEAALSECGAGCSVVLTFARCGAVRMRPTRTPTAPRWAGRNRMPRRTGLGRRRCRSAVRAVAVRVASCERGAATGVGSRPRHAAADPAGSRCGRLRRGRSGRPVRPAHAGGDSELAVVTGYPPDGLLEHPGGRGASRYWRVRCSGLGGRDFHIAGDRAGRAAGGGRRVGRPVLAVDREQHEPGRLPGVSGAVPERGVPRAGAESDVRRAAGRRVVLDGDFPAAWVLRLESESADGRDRDLDGRVRRTLGPGSGNTHVYLGWESTDGDRAPRGRQGNGPLGHSLADRRRGRPLRGRHSERPLRLSATRTATFTKARTWMARNGHFVIREADGDVAEGPYVDGERNGNWVVRFANGTVEERLYRDGEQVR